MVAFYHAMFQYLVYLFLVGLRHVLEPLHFYVFELAETCSMYHGHYKVAIRLMDSVLVFLRWIWTPTDQCLAALELQLLDTPFHVIMFEISHFPLGPDSADN